MNPHLERLARRVVNDPTFVAAALHCYAESEELDVEELAKHLGCPPAALPQVYLCQMPRAEAPQFWQDVQEIAGRFALNADGLAEAVRHGQSVLRMRGREAAGTSQPPAALLAARRRQPEPPAAPPASGGGAP